MNAPVPALDERGEFVVATLREGLTATIFTLGNGGSRYPISGVVHGTEFTWTEDGRYEYDKYGGAGDILNLDELRATVERAREMRAQRAAVDAALQDGGTGAWLRGTDEARAATRPTFAEALAAEAQQYNSRNVEWTELRSIIERARRASEGK